MKQWMIADLMVASLFAAPTVHASEPTLAGWPDSVYVHLTTIPSQPRQVIDIISALSENEQRTEGRNRLVSVC